MKDISVFQQSANYTYIQKYKALQINARCRGIGKTVAVNVRDRLSIRSSDSRNTQPWAVDGASCQQTL